MTIKTHSYVSPAHDAKKGGHSYQRKGNSPTSEQGKRIIYPSTGRKRRLKKRGGKTTGGDTFRQRMRKKGR